jgi:hypothetical protein
MGWSTIRYMKTVFRIRDILIRIRVLGSVHWITESDPSGPKTYGTDPMDPDHCKKHPSQNCKVTRLDKIAQYTKEQCSGSLTF